MTDTATQTKKNDDEDRQIQDTMSALMADPSAKKIMVIGGPDTGKTTTLHAMLSAATLPTALVDLDLGQSHVGPPAMLAWGWWRPEYGLLEQVVSERLFFVGATSPLANPTGAISGAAAVVSDAADHADKVLIDTSGAIAGRFARRLKLEKVKALRPDVVLALRRHAELDHILAEIEQERLARIVLLPVTKIVMDKSSRDRAAYRRSKFAEYFSAARQMRLSLDEVEVLRFGSASRTGDEYAGLVERLLVGLVDRVGRHQGLAILEAIDREGRALIVLGNLPAGSRAAALIPGRMRVMQDGSEQPLPK